MVEVPSPSLQDGYTDVPPGKIAAVVTHLAMDADPGPRQAASRPELSIARIDQPRAGWYRDLFRRVGAEDWLWFSRLALDDAGLEAIIRNPSVEVYALRERDRDEGLLELDFRDTGACEIAFFGVTGRLLGTGAGRHLMNFALATAWSRPIARLTVHTCTLDHPGALAFYLRSGFKAVRRQIEIADDPRLTGLLAQSAATHVPIIRHDGIVKAR
ncbi:MAG TPA: GNAT family N-acetyltransferase [Hyphomicrobiaceae bacterium]|nr:GNAT family N-acetyltransferase [Hyphomicrobiaceae bacterium]